jgi:O-antigen/teichoic acid export membrane protein
VRFIAHYRARRDPDALNEIASSAFCLFSAFGVLTYGIAVVLALSLGRLFHLSPDQAAIGRTVLLVTALYVAMGMAFSVFGAVINGFQLYHVNNRVGIASTLATAIVNVVVLQAGYGLIELVICTTAVRMLSYWVYRANAYRVVPSLRVRVGLFRRARVRELTTFSIYMAIIDWAIKVNYSVDVIVIGFFLNTAAVAMWSVPQRLAETTLRLTNQLNEVLFPVVVDHHTSSRLGRLQRILLVCTRLSLATVIPIGGALILLAAPLIEAWVGPDFGGSAIVAQLLALTVIVRVGCATSSVLLKGAGRHRLVAACNSATALVNLALSVALVRRWGLAGVAIGTLVPVASATLILVPSACRLVRLPIRRMLVESVWPALWPAAPMVAYVALTRPFFGLSLPAVALEMILSAGIYAAAFLGLAISSSDRRRVVNKLVELTGGPRVSMAPSEGV